MEPVENALFQIDYSPLVRNIPDTHKGDFGKVLIIGGNTSMTGSIHLAGRAAMLMGAGKTVLAPLKLQCHIDILMPELIIKPIAEVLPILDQFTVIVVGPGFGLDHYAQSVLMQILDYPFMPNSKLIFDADALNLIAAHENLRTKFINLLPFHKIITPHCGEAQRLLTNQGNGQTVQVDRMQIVQKLSLHYQSITLLKGYESLICFRKIAAEMVQNSETLGVFINKTGNQALSSAGQGDVLCGLIAGLAAQGLTLLHALKLAVYLHGRAADELVIKHGGYNGLLASEISQYCRVILNKILYF